MRHFAAVLGILSFTLAICNGVPAPKGDSSVCSGKQAYQAHSSDCNAFYQCADGKALLQHCQAGLHWNAKSDVCDWPENAGCSGKSGDDGEDDDDDDSGDSSKSSGDSSTSEESVPGSDSTSSDSSECPADKTKPKCPAKDPEFSVFFAHSDPHWFYHCSNGAAYCKQCPSNLVWNANCDTCDWEGQNNCPSSESGDSSKSSGDSSTSEESVPGSESSSSSESSECPEDKSTPKCPAKDPEFSVFFAHSDSHWFYHCSNGVAYCKQCPSNLVWNTNCDTCDWEGQNNCPSSESGDSSKSSGDSSTSEESVEGSESSSEE